MYDTFSKVTNPTAYPFSIELVLLYHAWLANSVRGFVPYDIRGTCPNNTELEYNALDFSHEARPVPDFATILVYSDGAWQWWSDWLRWEYYVTDRAAIAANTSNIGTLSSNVTSLLSRMTAAEGVNTTQAASISGNSTAITALQAAVLAAADHTPVATTRSLNSNWQNTLSRAVLAIFDVKVSLSASLAGGAEGEVFLEISPNGSTGWVTADKSSNASSVALAIALTVTQNLGLTTVGVIPPGYYARLRTNNVTGSPTYTYVSGQETPL